MDNEPDRVWNKQMHALIQEMIHYHNSIAESENCEPAKCFEQGILTPVNEVHHIVPISKGGTHARSNLMSLCKSCHTKIHHDIGDR